MATNTIPLVVDLDHTLIETDLLFLSSLGVLVATVAIYVFLAGVSSLVEGV